MPILFRCNRCQQKLSVSTRKAGTEIRCPKCERQIIVPVPEAKLITDDDEADSEPRQTEKKQSALPPTRELPEAEKAEYEAEEFGNESEKAWAPTREFRERPRRILEETAPELTPEESPIPPPPRPERIFPNRQTDEEEEFTLRKSETELEEMDLTPMVDVTFLLLIFFMITASFSMTKAIETPAPDPENKGAQTIQNLEELELTSIMVRIDEQDSIFVDDEPVGDPDQLEDIFGDKLRTEQKNELVIQASPKCRHETFVKVFDAATGAGMQKIRLATSSGGEE